MSMTNERAEDIRRIEEAIDAAAEIFKRFTPGDVEVMRKDGGDPVTAADTEVDAKMHEVLLRDGEGWLSEETVDDPARLNCSRVWVVDPIDGTKEFVTGIPEWCISIGLVTDGKPVAGGIFNPATGQRVVGSVEGGVTLNGEPISTRNTPGLAGAEVLASRSEIKRGEWERFADARFNVKPCGSVASKMGMVAAGQTNATWTLVPKHEWDVAAGTALVLAAGGYVVTKEGEPPLFNREKPKFTGLIATAGSLRDEVDRLLGLS